MTENEPQEDMADELIEKGDAPTESIESEKNGIPENVFRITSLNVFSMNAAWKKGLESYINEKQPDIFCVQETKLHPESKPTMDAFKLKGYEGYFSFAEKKGYSGTGIYTKIKPISVQKSEGITDKNGRCITMEFSNFYLLNTYVVNMGMDLKNRDEKINIFNPEIERHIQKLKQTKPVIWTGDLNVAHNPIDIYTTEGMNKIAGYTDDERKWFDNFIKNNDYVDVFRYLYPNKQQYTYFGYRYNMKAKNQGWRIDYFMMPRSMIRENLIYDSIIETADLSDHEPISLFLNRSMILSDQDKPVESTSVNEIGKKPASNILSFFTVKKK